MDSYFYFCSDSNIYLETLKNKNIFKDLGVPSTVRKYIHNIILTEQKIYKRGVLKYASFCFQGDPVDRLMLSEALPTALNDNSVSFDIINQNDYTTINVFCGNLTKLMKLTESILFFIRTRRVTDGPRISITADLSTVDGISYYLNDISSVITAMQLTPLQDQHGLFVLGLTDLSDDLIGMLLLFCLNANGKIKLYLLCNKIDREIWYRRAIDILQSMNINISFTVLDNIILQL